MKRFLTRAGVLLAALVVIGLMACQQPTNENDTSADDVAAVKAALVINYSTGDSDSMVTSNLTLPTTGAKGVSIAWASNNTSVVSPAGVVIRPTVGSADIAVTLTATLSKKSISSTKIFLLSVRALPNTSANDVATVKSGLEIGYSTGDSSSSVTGNLFLPAGTNGVSVAWSSNKTAFVSDSGVVTRPATGLSDVSVTLTATLTKAPSGSETKVFLVTVKAQLVVDTSASDVAAVKAALGVAYAVGDSAAQVTANLSLSTTGANGVAIAWASNNVAVVSHTGVVTRPVIGQSDASVTLTATLSKNSVIVTKVFDLTVKSIPDTSVAEVAAAKMALGLNYAVGDSANNVTENLFLPTSGGNGISISWASNTGAISATGIVTRPASGQSDTVVTLTATLTKAPSGSDTKVFTLTVKALPVVQTYSMTFNTNGGSTVASRNGLSSGSLVTKPADPTKSGHTFSGWYKEFGLFNAWDFVVDTVTIDTMLYAKWTALPFVQGLIPSSGARLEPTTIQVDRQDNVVVVLFNQSFSPLTSVIGSHSIPAMSSAAVIYSRMGEVLDFHLLDGTIADSSKKRRLTFDSAGNNYIIGETSTGLDGQSFGGGSLDCFVQKFDNQWNKLWTRQIGGVGDDFALGLAVGPQGEVYVAGSTSSDFGDDKSTDGAGGFVVKFDSAGNQLWSLNRAGQVGKVIGFGDIFIASNGDIICTGRTNCTSLDGQTNVFTGPVPPQPMGLIAQRFSSSGQWIWTRTFAGGFVDFNKGATLDDQDNLYFTGNTFSSTLLGEPGEQENGPSVSYLCRINSDGTIGWLHTYQNNSLGEGLLMSPSGNVLMLARGDKPGVGPTVWVQEVTTAGVVVGETWLDSPYYTNPQAAALDSAGRLYVLSLFNYQSQINWLNWQKP